MKEGERAGNKRKGGRELKRSKRSEGRRRQQNNKRWCIELLNHFILPCGRTVKTNAIFNETNYLITRSKVAIKKLYAWHATLPLKL